MSFLKNILKPFVEFKEGIENQESAVETGTQQKAKRKEKVVFASETGNSHVDNNPGTDAATSSKTARQATSRSSETNDYHTYFENLIEEANTKNPVFQGTDFKEFIDSKIDVEAISDEGTRYKTAFNVLKRTGLTKDKLVTTGHEYIKLIEKDLKGFKDAYAQQYNADVEQKEQLLQKKAEELQALNEKITVLNNEMKQMSQQIIQNKEKLDANKNAFIDAGEEKKQEIAVELQKIDQYF